MSSDFFPVDGTQIQVAIPGPNYAYWGGRNLYLNLTSRCSAACTFCIHNFTWDIFGYDLRLEPGQQAKLHTSSLGGGSATVELRRR